MINPKSSFSPLVAALALLNIPFLAAAPDVGAQGSCIVKLLTPAPGAVMSQQRVDGGKVESRWRFSWAPCPGATRYHLHVIGPGALNPIVDIDTLRTTSHEDRSTHYGITNRQGWTWKARAHVDGRWGEWSETRTFDVSAILPTAQSGGLPGTCSISGRITGPLRFDVRDDRGQPLSLRLTEMVMKTAAEPQRTRRAPIRKGVYVFSGLPAGVEYRVYAAGFRSEPRERSVRCLPNTAHGDEHFRITGPPLYE